MKVTSTDGRLFQLQAESADDHVLIDAFDFQREVKVMFLNKVPENGGLENIGATLEVSATADWALLRNAGRDTLRALGDLQRLSLIEATDHGHVGALATNPQTDEALATSVKKLQLMLQAFGSVVVQNNAQAGVGAHEALPVFDPRIVAQPNTNTPPPIGQPWPSQGGTYLGIHNGQHLVAMTAPECSFEGAWGEYGKDVSGATSRTDGAANTKAMADAGSAIASKVLALEVDGHKDLFIPSQSQLQHAYATAPEAFEKSGWHWSSTQDSRNGAFVQDFEYGYSGWGLKDGECRVRAFRVVQLEALTT